MGEENEQVDSAISRLHDLECWCHQIKQGSHKRGVGGRDWVGKGEIWLQCSI